MSAIGIDYFLAAYVFLILPLSLALIVFFASDKKKHKTVNRIAVSFMVFIGAIALEMLAGSYILTLLQVSPLFVALVFYFTIGKKYASSDRLAISVGVFSGILILLALLALPFLQSSQSGGHDYLSLPESLTYCQYGAIEAYAITTNAELNADQLIIKTLLDSNGLPVKDFDILPDAFPLKRGQQAKKIISYNCTTGCKGTYTIILGTAYMRITRPVTCD